MVRLVFALAPQDGTRGSLVSFDLDDKKARLLLDRGVTYLGAEDRIEDSRSPVCEVGPDGGFILPPEFSKGVKRGFFDSLKKNAEQRDIETTGRSEQTTEPKDEIQPLDQTPIGQLWLLRQKNGDFVKTTTEEGGLSYIACTSEQEAQKVAQAQKIYDIESVPHRVI